MKLLIYLILFFAFATFASWAAVSHNEQMQALLTVTALGIGIWYVLSECRAYDNKSKNYCDEESDETTCL